MNDSTTDRKRSSKPKAKIPIRRPRSVGAAPDGYLTNTRARNETVVSVAATPAKLPATRAGRTLCVIFTLALIAGLRVSPSMTSPPWLARLLRKWCGIMFRISTLFILVLCAHNHLFWPSLALRYSYFFHCLTGYAVMVLFRVKGRDIAASVERIAANASSGYQSNATRKCRLVEAYMSICLVCFTAFSSFGIYFFYCLFADVYFEILSDWAPFSKDSVLFYCYKWMLVFAVMASYHISWLTLFVTSSLCGFSYLLLGDSICLFGRRLENDVRRGSLMAYSASLNMRRFKHLFAIFATADRTLNVAAGMVYAAVINGAYTSLSLKLSNESRFQTLNVNLITAMISIDSTVAFFFLTLSGDYIARQKDLLDLDLIGMSDIVLNLSQSIRSVHMFSVLSANIRTMEFRATGFTYFKITRKIILRAFGVMVTYGSWIHQIEAFADL